ncbi:ABC transporter substrate-binding protein [Propionicicella superfundia]|uniref:ABC transporter substrate-binding protein n=1 Tax=Propionicicella superfundia TaxID=348582 RepID=UPI0003FE1D15|nr:ABC transporter substrate-binding protein [Propionicicella superfundia]
MRKARIAAAMAMATALVMATSGCLGGGGTSQTSQEETAKTEITVMYAFGGEQNTAFRKDLDAWASQNGLKINYIQSDTFPALIQSKVASGDVPDIAIFPQPGILKGLAEKGKLAKLSTQTDVESIKADILPGFLDAATVDGEVYGAPISMNVKSLYWYSKKNFAAKGYTVPKTEAELEALIEKVKADGVAPVCYGMESGSDTGWPATDWIEDYMLQTNGAEVYDKWVNHEVKFDSDEVRKAFDVYTKIIMTDGNVYGGAKKSASVAFATALNPMFGDSPKCYFGKQGNFITQSGFFPDAISKNLDEEVGVFETPTVNGEHPVLGGGDLAAAFTMNDKNVKKVMDFLTNDASFGTNLAATGSVLSPHKSFDASKYPNDTIREVVTIAQNATVFRFDGSDQMPAAVGAKSFWTNMVDYTSGTQDLTATLKAIDASWPS